MSERLSVLPYGRQDIDEDDLAAVAAALRSDFLTTGPLPPAFEAALAERVEAPHAVVCSSATAGLHIAAMTLDLKPGERVVVPSLTFLATATAPHLCGAEIVFADVDPDSGLMRPEDLAEALARAGGPVRAVFPVHLNGQCVDSPALAALARDHGLSVIEDASHALGTRYAQHTDGAHDTAVGACAHADMAVFSFHPVKTIAMGEGGAVTTRDPARAERLARLRSHGLTRDPGHFTEAAQAFDAAGQANPWYYELHETGLNYRASDIHCALGLSQLAKLDRLVARRRDLVARYDALLEPLAPLIRPVARMPWCSAAWHLYAVLVDFPALAMERAEAMRRLRASGIGTQVHYIPLHLQPYYRARFGALSLPGAERYYARCLSLPLHTRVSDDDVERVVEALTSLADGA